MNNERITRLNLFELAMRETEWLLTANETKLSADDFYRSHRTSALGEYSYRDYIIKKLEFIEKYTNEQNSFKAFASILLGKKKDYKVPIEFTRYLIKSIKERFNKFSLHVLKR